MSSEQAQARTAPDEARRLDDLAGPAAWTAGVAGVTGLAAAILLALISGDLESFFRGYIHNVAFFTSMALGALFFVLIQHLTRAGWSVVVRRTAENLMMAFPMLALLMAPVLLGLLLNVEALQHVYPWTDHEHVQEVKVLAGKTAYLNVPFFILRLAIYFGAWVLLARYFRGRSVEQDASGDPSLTSRMQGVSAPAVFVFALTTTFFAVDVLMTLDPTWYSTIFGVYFFAGGVMGAAATMALVLALLQAAGRIRASVHIEHFHDLGKLIFAFTVFWAYIGYSQYMLIWYGNLPEETSFYIIRQQPDWLWLSLTMLVGHFAVPFLAMISRWPKRSKMVLLVAAAWMIAMHWLDLAWLVLPHNIAPHGEFPQAAPGTVVQWAQSLALLFGVGGAVTWAVVQKMGQADLIAHRDPRLGESLAFENI